MPSLNWKEERMGMERCFHFPAGYYKEQFQNSLHAVKVCLRKSKIKGRKEFSATGIMGEIGKIDKFLEWNEEYMKDLDMEDEYGYLADEQKIFDKEEREKYLESLRWQLIESGDFPTEISHENEYEDYTITYSSGGQNLDDVNSKDFHPLIAKSDLDFIMDLWHKKHLKPITKNDEKRLNKIADKYDYDELWEKAIKELDI
jgi:hypothetical protein